MAVNLFWSIRLKNHVQLLLTRKSWRLLYQQQPVKNTKRPCCLSKAFLIRLMRNLSFLRLTANNGAATCKLINAPKIILPQQEEWEAEVFVEDAVQALKLHRLMASGKRL